MVCLQDVFRHHTILSSTSTLNCPEKILILDIVGHELSAICRNNRHLEDLISTQAKLTG